MFTVLLRGFGVLVTTGTDIDVQVGAEQTLFGGAVSAFFTTLVVGALGFGAILADRYN